MKLRFILPAALVALVSVAVCATPGYGPPDPENFTKAPDGEMVRKAEPVSAQQHDIALTAAVIGGNVAAINERFTTDLEDIIIKYIPEKKLGAFIREVNVINVRSKLYAEILDTVNMMALEEHGHADVGASYGAASVQFETALSISHKFIQEINEKYTITPDGRLEEKTLDTE